MGREFLGIFSEWATDYDQTVTGKDPEYRDVFTDYDELLEKMALMSGETVLEFGSGTGNLTLKLLNKGKKVYPVEPSLEMIAVAKEKAELKKQVFIEGDLEVFPVPPYPIDTIVASFVFHHLTEAEKEKVIHLYHSLLPKSGKIIIGDTMFLSSKSYQSTLNDAFETGKLNLAEDLKREYYPFVSHMDNYFKDAGFTTKFSQVNQFAWIVEAIKM